MQNIKCAHYEIMHNFKKKYLEHYCILFHSENKNKNKYIKVLCTLGNNTQCFTYYFLK